MDKMKLLTVREVSEALGVAQVTVRLWIAQRRFSYVKLGRSVRIPEGEVARLVEEGTVASPRKSLRASTHE